jgi:hypothetical protein
MAQYYATSPTGERYRITAPDDATPEQLQSYVKQQFGALGHNTDDMPEPGAPQLASGGDSSEPGKLVAFGAGADDATLGLPRLIVAAAQSVHNGKSFSENWGNLKSEEQIAEAAHPVMNILGEGAGMLATAPLMEAATPFRALRAALELKQGQPIANIGRMMAQGAITGGEYGALRGGVEGAQDGGGATGAAVGAATGATLGAVGGGLGSGVTGTLAKGAMSAWDSLTSDASQRAVRLLAKRLDMNPDDLQTLMDNFRRQTGRPPALADVLNAKSQANLDPIINTYQSSAAKQMAATDAEIKALPKNAMAAIRDTGKTKTPFNGPGGGTISTSDVPGGIMVDARKAVMDARMGRPGDPAALRNQPVLDQSDLESLWQNPKIRAASMGDNELLGTIKDTLKGKDVLTVDDIDNLRQQLRRQQYSLLGSNSIRANKWGQVADELEQLGRTKQSGYGQALDDFKRQSNFIDGYTYAANGGSLNAPNGDAMDQAARGVLKTPEGQMGMELGARSRLIQQAKSQQGAASQARDLATGGSQRELENLPADQAAHLRGYGEAQSAALKSRAAITAPSLGAKQEESAKAVQNLGEMGLAMKGHVTTGFSAHAISRFIKGLGVRESTANGLVDIINDPSRSSQLPAAMRAAGIRERDQHKIIGVITKYGGISRDAATAELEQ